MLRRRRPLLRAAAVGGGAYMAGKSRARSQEREYQQDAQIQDLQANQSAPAAAPAPAAGGFNSGTIEQLKQLGTLHEQGVLTDDEFTQQKARLLGS